MQVGLDGRIPATRDRADSTATRTMKSVIEDTLCRWYDNRHNHGGLPHDDCSTRGSLQ
jgi:hypothetical protein